MTVNDSLLTKGVQDAEERMGSSLSQGRFFLTNEFGLILLIVVFAVSFGVAAGGFLSPFNLFTLGRSAAINIMIGLSMMAVIVTGGLNLAVGAIGVSAAMACGYLIEVLGVPWPLALSSAASPQAQRSASSTAGPSSVRDYTASSSHSPP
ncbi:hypothetical protein [Agrobacterium fabrum]|uniref:hypothetical protein n=1 Tax=Agrobacterium fabrum TaxID=1176649 RepID=UPI000F0D08A6|nr:hypothetical protein [Agrobacterium fabrum]AYM59341.1 hypothetical protein At1D132_33290 [Agrobacterium fabrum]